MIEDYGGISNSGLAEILCRVIFQDEDYLSGRNRKKLFYGKSYAKN